MAKRALASESEAPLKLSIELEIIMVVGVEDKG
jgi:hypothetical protein